MRGKVAIQLHHSMWTGITPAYAGKSLTTISLYSSTGDHPRLCGEKQSRTFAFAVIIGSPPPMRGKGFRKKSVEGH